MLPFGSKLVGVRCFCHLCLWEKLVPRKSLSPAIVLEQVELTVQLHLPKSLWTPSPIILFPDEVIYPGS